MEDIIHDKEVRPFQNTQRSYSGSSYSRDRSNQIQQKSFNGYDRRIERSSNRNIDLRYNLVNGRNQIDIRHKDIRYVPGTWGQQEKNRFYQRPLNQPRHIQGN